MKKNFSKSLSAFALMLISTITIFAQAATTISGHVTDPQAASVTGATITLYARDSRVLITTTTDANGAYHFEGISPGEYVVAVDAAGFTRNARPLRTEHGSTTLDISLEIAGVNSEVIVTAQGTPQTIDEVSKAVSVVNVDQIERRDENSLVDALRPVPGVRVEQLGGPGGFSKILIRGLRVVDTSVLLMGCG